MKYGLFPRTTNTKCIHEFRIWTTAWIIFHTLSLILVFFRLILVMSVTSKSDTTDHKVVCHFLIVFPGVDKQHSINSKRRRLQWSPAPKAHRRNVNQSPGMLIQSSCWWSVLNMHWRFVNGWIYPNPNLQYLLVNRHEASRMCYIWFLTKSSWVCGVYHGNTHSRCQIGISRLYNYRDSQIDFTRNDD